MKVKELTSILIKDEKVKHGLSLEDIKNFFKRKKYIEVNSQSPIKDKTEEMSDEK